MGVAVQKVTFPSFRSEPRCCLNDICFVHFCFLSAFADAAVDPIDFPIAPAYAIPKVTMTSLPLFTYFHMKIVLKSSLDIYHSSSNNNAYIPKYQNI